MPVLHFAIFLVLCSTIISFSDSLVSFNYTEVRKFGNSCPHLDTCEYQGPSNQDRNCACDELCVRYGDCCIDAPGVVALTSPSTFSCFELVQLNLPERIGIYMKDSCLPSYDGPEEVRRLCESISFGDPSDPLRSLPVTDPVNGITFKNYYCSVCNEKVDNMVLWTPGLKCPTLFERWRKLSKEYVLHNLVYENERWGLYLQREGESLFFHVCSIHPFMPTSLEGKVRLCKQKLVSDCPPDWQDDDTRTMCKSYMGERFINESRFRNIHCAYCNQQNLTLLSCKERKVTFYVPNPKSITLLLDINEGDGQIQLCNNGEIYDPFFRKCRNLQCLPGFMKREVLRDTFVDVSVSGAIALQPETEKSGSKERRNGVLYTPGNINSRFQNADRLSYDLLASNGDNLKDDVSILQNCQWIPLTDEDYTKFPNLSVYVPKFDKIYDPTSYYTTNGSISVCTPCNNETMPPLGYVITVGLSLSMVCLFLHFIAFWVVPDLQNLSGKSLVSECVALFFAYAFFIMGLHHESTDVACTVIAFFTFYFFQVAFFWMGVIAYDFWRSLKIATTELRVSGGKQIKRFLAYSLFTWFAPLLLVCILVVAEYTSLFPLQYRPDFAEPHCWFKRGPSHLVFFAGPLFLIMVLNIVFFVCSSRIILITTHTSAKHQNQARNFKMYLRLALIMGLTWIIGAIAAYCNIQILWYILNILNTLHGLFIFIFFTCSTKVRKYLKGKLNSSQRASRSSQGAPRTCQSSLPSRES
ncbi:g-protein coupled receptor Mth2 [Nephila pilipes]|uniref:G-protein coupled receptor Mth2 n=1 Tax=Nephila pilipes TaxID=299642 RepID=A0A8X6UPV8_NEPPI|nr:g-protein coupled receptor Mth2 [Nephila pilipes]